MSTKLEKFTVYTSSEIAEAVNALALAEKRTKSKMCEILIEEALKQRDLLEKPKRVPKAISR